MNYYDDSEEYSSANSFRARSNTWPLNRPDLAIPAGICIDETLPEIELEDEDLFTTNENWSTGLVDHDIMSWDPILGAQASLQHPNNSQHQNTGSNGNTTASFNTNTTITTTTTSNNTTTNTTNNTANAGSHHQPQISATIDTNDNQHTTTHHNHHPPRHHTSTIHHQPTPQQERQAAILQQHHLNHQQHQQLPHPQPQQNQHLHHPQHILTTTERQQQQHHNVMLASSSSLLSSQQQLQPARHQHPTLNSSHCLDVDDPNDYHVQQMHQLRLDNQQPLGPEEQTHYISPIAQTPMCMSGSISTMGTGGYGISSDHSLNHVHNQIHHHHQHPQQPQHHLHHQQQHHHHNHHQHLQPLISARYDSEVHDDLNHKSQDDSEQPQLHQLHHLTSRSLNHRHSSQNILSSSLSTSGIGMSGDLEDLDYKGVEPSLILNDPQFEELQHQQEHQQQQQGTSQQQQGTSQQQNDNTNANTSKPSGSSNANNKAKLTTPRRNAWGNMSYADLISEAINSTTDKRLTLSQIYDWMVQNVEYFKDKGDSNSSAGWKNSVRHNLSLHNRFKRLQNEGTGKSSWWTINPEANVGKCARRRAASMEASKYEKKRGRAKKRAEAIRQGLVSYPSLTNSSLNGSATALYSQQPSHHQSSDQFGGSQQQQQAPQPQPPQQQAQQTQQQQPQQLRELIQPPQQSQQQTDGLSSNDFQARQSITGLYVTSTHELSTAM